MPEATSDSSEGRIYPMRLQKYLARAGVASRRGSEDLMTAGRVTVNGVVVTELGSKVDPNTDDVAVDGNPVSLADGPRYIILNKPLDTVTTMDDPQGRRCVREFMPADVPGLFPVGRLDRNTTGLLLLTTDGDIAHRLMHPSYHVEKTYEARVSGHLTKSELDRLQSGLELEDGMTKPAQAEVIGGGSNTDIVRIVISEGRKRQVRRMFEALGHRVVDLHRSRFGPIADTGLSSGAVRDLSPEEIAQLKQVAGMGGE